MIFKKCKYGPCKGLKKCADPDNHPIWFQVKNARLKINERGPIQKYLFLWPVGRAVPTTIAQAAELEALIVTWVAHGRPPVGPPTSPEGSTPPPDGSTPDGAPTLVGPALDAYKKAVMDKSDDDGTPTHERRMRAYFGGLPLAALWDRAHIRTYLERVTGPVSQNRHRSRLMHFAAWTVAEYTLTPPASPWFDAKTNRVGHKRNTESDGRTRRLAKHEEPALVNAAGKFDDGGQMLGRIYCAIDCGLRRGEMLKVKRDDVIRNYEGSGRTVIRVTWQASKVKKTRFVPVETKRLRSWLNARAFAEFPFGQADGSRLDHFRKDWIEILNAAGLETYEWSERRQTKSGKKYAVRVRTSADADLHWHDLRHECGSRLAGNNVPLFEIMRLMGHSSLKTTQKYLNSDLQSLAANMRKAQRGAIEPRRRKGSRTA